MTKRLTVLLFIALQATFAQQWSIGMYAPYGNPGCPISDIDMSAVTHIVHWAALVNSDGSLDLTYQRISSDAQPLISTAHASGVKVLLGILNPYFLGQNGNLPNAVANHRGALVGNIMSVVNSYGYDGVDIDWEGSPVDVGALASDLRSQLGSKLLTANAIVTDYRYWGSVQGYFDRVNIMTYDMTGTWEPYTWYNAALYGPDESVWSVDLAVRRYIANGVPASKLGIGIPFYGWQWTGGGVTGPRQTWSSTPSLSQVSYQSLAPSLSPQLYGWDAAAHTSYQTGANGFLTYDDERSVTDKVNYARANNLGGWIIWNLSNDYMPSRSPKHPLLTAVRNAMGSANAPPIVSPVQAPATNAVLRDNNGSIRLSTYPSSSLSNSGGAFASDPSAAEDLSGNVFTVARDSSNAAWTNVYNIGSASWLGWQFGGGSIQGQPAIAVTPNGTAWITGRDNSSAYWLVSYTTRGGYGSWIPLHGSFTTDPVIAACGDGSIYVVGKDSFSALWSGRYIPGTGFQNFVLFGGAVTGKPSVSCGSDNAIYIVAQDSFHSNWVARVSGNTWTGWFNGGAGTSIDPRIAALGGSLAVVILDGGGSAWRNTFTEGIGNGWQSWTNVGGSLQDISPGCVNGELFFFGRATNGLWWWRQTGNLWTWIGNNGVATGALAATPH